MSSRARSPGVEALRVGYLASSELCPAAQRSGSASGRSQGATCNTRPRPVTRGPAPGRAALRPCVPPAPPEAPPCDATPRPISARFQDGGCSACPAVRVAVTTGSRGPGMWSKDGGGERPGQKLRATGRRSLAQRLQTRWNKEPVPGGSVDPGWWAHRAR